MCSCGLDTPALAQLETPLTTAAIIAASNTNLAEIRSEPPRLRNASGITSTQQTSNIRPRNVLARPWLLSTAADVAAIVVTAIVTLPVTFTPSPESCAGLNVQEVFAGSCAQAKL